MTAFVHTRVPVAPGLSFVIDGNSKITASNGTYANPVPNAFSLPAASVMSNAGHCPGSTAVCRASCYVRGLAKNALVVYSAYQENSDALTWVLAESTRFELAADRLGAWIAENVREFRWHVSGDVRDVAHALWITRVCQRSPNVAHWIYTRTLHTVAALRCASNLAVNVSADRENYAQARHVADLFNARLTYLTTAPDDRPADLPADAVVFPDYPLRGRDLAEPTEHPWWQSLTHEERKQVCPADQFGQSEAHRCGPCSRCMVPR